jgi:hypothetical protein
MPPVGFGLKYCPARHREEVILISFEFHGRSLTRFGTEVAPSGI